MFAPLSLAVKERLAANLAPLSLAPGDRVVEMGEVGHEFYLVADGEFDVDAGTTRSTASAGDYFGEIALLRDVPRTATVTARTPSRLYALPRAAFLAAVTAHAGAHAAGREVAASRLARGGQEALK
jgi:CRP-like cAMP-binding protein